MAFKTASKTQVIYPKLDIADRSSVRNLASSVKEKHGVVDVLINNAGVNLDDEYSAENVKVTLDTNVRGTLQVSMDYVVFGVKDSLKGAFNLPMLPNSGSSDFTTTTWEFTTRTFFFCLVSMSSPNCYFTTDVPNI